MPKPRRHPQGQKTLDDALTKQKQELDLFIAQGNEKAKTLKERLKLEEDIMQKSLKLLEVELQAKKITQLEYEKEVLNIKKAFTENVTNINVEQSRALLELELQRSKSLLNEGKKLSQDLLNEEQKRLDKSLQQQIDQLAKEQQVEQARLDDNNYVFSELTAKEAAYLKGKEQLIAEHDNTIRANQAALAAQEKQEKAEKKLIDVALAQTEYDEKLVLEQQRHEAELERLNEWKEQGLITEAQYQEHLQSLEEETAKNKQRLALQNAQTQLGTLQNVANALGEAFGQSKEMTIAQAP